MLWIIDTYFEEEGQSMTTVHAKVVGDTALLPKAEFERLVELARQSEEIELQLLEGDLPTQSMMRLAEQGNAFDFWCEEGEDIYSAKDGEPL